MEARSVLKSALTGLLGLALNGCGPQQAEIANQDIVKQLSGTGTTASALRDLPSGRFDPIIDNLTNHGWSYSVFDIADYTFFPPRYARYGVGATGDAPGLGGALRLNNGVRQT
jgi:hypothetical protein